MLLTPSEYEFIKEQVKDKEENFKYRSSQWCWQSQKKLFDELPKDLIVKDLVDTKFKGYEIIGNPKFVPLGNKNKVVMKFKIRRIDHTKSWCNDTLEFEGEIELEVKDNDLTVNVVKNMTSSETEEVCDKVIAYLKSTLEQKKCISDKQTNILFSSFDNEKRIEFFWKLTGDITDSFINFQEISDIDIKPDNSLNFPVDLSIEWMKNKVDKLSLKGNSLHDTFFITDINCRPYLIIWRMEAKYSFDNHFAKGACRISFDFPRYSKSNNSNAEFTISITNLILDKNSKSINKNKVKQYLKEQVDKKKFEVFKVMVL